MIVSPDKFGRYNGSGVVPKTVLESIHVRLPV